MYDMIGTVFEGKNFMICIIKSLHWTMADNKFDDDVIQQMLDIISLCTVSTSAPQYINSIGMHTYCSDKLTTQRNYIMYLINSVIIKFIVCHGSTQRLDDANYEVFSLKNHSNHVVHLLVIEAKLVWQYRRYFVFNIISIYINIYFLFFLIFQMYAYLFLLCIYVYIWPFGQWLTK